MKVSFISNQNRVAGIIAKTFFKVLSIFLTNSLLVDAASEFADNSVVLSLADSTGCHLTPDEIQLPCVTMQGTSQVVFLILTRCNDTLWSP
ncbi:hypothetical protein OO184_04565 [Photorhabdus sp. APURE]|uniref:hypothetical protein n=1 Tax=Photorhabdus aballayi TaxID=2991723 RepID=UPI00223E7EDC|nr:hypothetical protein [Photorhabdus aballayi]MCW7547234.1 hypothetical protein [Photorhabdus aballayi]